MASQAAAERTERRRADSLEHTSKVGYMRRYDGTLFCVALKVGARPRLRFWDFQADWRPGYEADYHGEKGAWREVQEAMSEPPTSQRVLAT